MKKKLKKLLQKPLRFHHQDIHEELALIRVAIDDVKYQMQELREAIRESSNKNEELRVPELYEHPWDQHIREGFVCSGDCVGGTERNVYSESVATRLGFSGGEATTQGPTN
tara:strand:+ start:1714 stop:2046 length:333 start_codon:yes stop_codon:yes gene_type:complete